MSEDSKSIILRAFRLLLQPIVRTLVRSGVTWKEAAEVCKTTFVEVASREFGLHGRPTNMSRVAIMTGLGRRDVSRIRKLLADEQPVDFRRMNNATRLLTGWHLDAAYLDDLGQPRDLLFTGNEPSFTGLARKHAGDIAPITMSRELQRVGAVMELDDGSLRVLKRFYMPLAIDADAVLRGGSVLRDLGNTIDYNLVRDTDTLTRFEGRATNVNIHAVDLAEFRAYLEEEGQSFLERVDEWLTRHEPSTETRRKYKKMRLGVGIYQIQDDDR
jgi:hypothetical protein